MRTFTISKVNNPSMKVDFKPDKLSSEGNKFRVDYTFFPSQIGWFCAWFPTRFQAYFAALKWMFVGK